MPFPALSKTTQKRAMTQASSNTESSEARVVKTYADALGNITAADVVVKGQVAALVRVANASGIKLYNGATVEVRSLTGNVHARQITGAAGSSTTDAVSAQQAADSVAVSGVPPVPSALSDAPVLLQSASGGAGGGYVEVPGANVAYTDTDPSTDGSGNPVSGQRLVDVKPLVVASLPAVPTTLRDGTLVCLVDSYGGSQGLWRLDAAAQVWRRVDAGSVKATSTVFGTVETDITEAGGSVVYTKTTADSTFATQTALGNEATARASGDASDAAARAAGDALALQKSANLSDLGSSATARTSLGLGTAAVANLPAAGSNASAAQAVRGDDTRLGASTPLATTTPTAETVSATGAVGTSTSAARADHVHAMPATYPPNAHTHAGTDITSGTVPAARLPVATASAVGAVKPGTNLTVAADGTLNASGGGSTTLAGDTDVLIASPTDGQVLTYVAAASKWENKTLTTSGGTQTTLFQIAAGNASGVTPFTGDQLFSGGVAQSISVGGTVSQAGVANPPPLGVYNNVRGNFSPFSYTFTGLTAGRQYLIRLHFNDQKTAGQRIFSVSINGTTQLSNFDIAAAAGGPNKAIVREFTLPANSSGQLAITFTNNTDQAIVNALELIQPSIVPYSGDIPPGSTIHVQQGIVTGYS